MKDGIIFVAGIYGVGKSTLCERLSISIGIPCYSAGDLISAINGEIYGRISRLKYREYFSGCTTAYAFALGSFKRYETSKSLADFNIQSVPQSFVYLDD